MAHLTGHEITVRTWESRLGREGLWCKGCRHLTPPALLVVDGVSAVLACESCQATLRYGESWLSEVARLLPVQPSMATWSAAGVAHEDHRAAGSALRDP